MFTKILIANRGEIACRVIRACQQMGIDSVAVYSDADAGSLHVREATEAVRIGPAAASQSYLSIEAIIAAATATGAQAIHPGYGFLAENAEFARACAEAGIVFIGPGLEALEVMGDKISSKQQVARFGVPLVEGVSEPGLTDAQLIERASGMPYPVLIKPSAGGGGKGMHVVERPEDLPETLVTARRVAAQSFGDDTLFIEQLVRTPRHIEVQILADAHGNTIHLGERECSLQRRHQKVIEEAPSALLDEATRARIGEAAVNAARSVDYVGAGTVEFLVAADEPEKFYFMEMNTRLQVEHPVTEMVTGIDLVQWQIRIAAGEELTLAQEDVRLNGHSFEARVYAENPARGFLPTEGTLLACDLPEAYDAVTPDTAERTAEAGLVVRVDTGISAGQTVGLDYDPMLAKIITWGEDRDAARARMLDALEQTAIHGVGTNIEYLHALLSDEDVAAGRLDTGLIERKMSGIVFAEADGYVLARAEEASGLGASVRGQMFACAPNSGSCFPGASQFSAADPQPTGAWDLDGFSATTPLPGSPGPQEEHPFDLARNVRTTLGHGSPDTAEGRTVWATEGAATFELTVHSRTGALAKQLAEIEHEAAAVGPELRSPMPGTVVAVAAPTGTEVEEGQTVLTVEAMKMEHHIRAGHAGTVTVDVAVGDQVKLDQLLGHIAVAESDPELP